MHPNLQAQRLTTSTLSPILEFKDLDSNTNMHQPTLNSWVAVRPLNMMRNDEAASLSSHPRHRKLSSGLEIRSDEPIAASIPTVWRSIGSVVSQLKSMQQHICVSSAIVKVMSAILVEAADVQETKRKIKEDLAREGRKSVASEASGSQAQLGKRLSDLLKQVDALQELLSSDRPPSEQEVLEVLSGLKISRIRTMATAALGFKRLKASASKGIGSLTYRSALGLPSLQLRKREKKAGNENVDVDMPSEDLCLGKSAPEILEQVQARALQYSKTFSAIALRHVRSRAGHSQGSSQVAPIGIPSLPQKHKMKSKQRAQAKIDEATWKASCSVLA